MKLDLAPYQAMLIECKMCGQYVNKDNAVIDALFFGFTQYAVCLCCGNEVPKSEWTRSYKWKWTRKFNQMKEERKQCDMD